MAKHYEAAEIVEIGNASVVVLGLKPDPTPDNGTGESGEFDPATLVDRDE